MKCFIILCIVASAIAAELPRFRPARFRFQRQELAPTTTDAPTEATTEQTAPYPAAGWQPKVPFNLPMQAAPSDTYGAPQQAPYPPSGWKPQQPFTLPNETPDNTYGAPDTSYGVPDESTEPTTDNPEAEKLETPVEVQKSSGKYYLLLPNGQLQEVEFMTENDVQKMAYTARLRVKDSAPLFFFRP